MTYETWQPVKVGRAKVTMTVYCDVYAESFDDGELIEDPLRIIAEWKEDLESKVPGTLYIGDFEDTQGAVVEYAIELVEVPA